MPKRTIIIMAVCASIFGCGSKKEDQSSRSRKADTVSAVSIAVPTDSISKTENINDIGTYLTKLEVEDRLVQAIDPPCAIFVEGTEEQKKEFFGTMSEEDRAIVADDENYYSAIMFEILDSLRVKSIHTTNRFLRLKGKKEWLLDTKKKNLPMERLILFAVDKDPWIVELSTMEIDTIASYFGITAYNKPPPWGR